MNVVNLLIAKYYRIKSVKVLMKALILLVFIASVSLVNKTWLTDNSIIIGEVDDILYWTGEDLVRRVRISIGDILGIYLGLKFLDLFIDLVYDGIHSWSVEYRRGKRYRETEAEEDIES